MLPPSPSDLLGLTSTAVVEAAIERHAAIKEASPVLSGRPPDDGAAAAVLVAAFEAGRAPAWLTAHLLGCLRVPATYEVVRRILVDAPGLLAESYAGAAMARIAGAAARSDLLDLMRSAARRRSREGALFGLGELGDVTSIAAIVAAAREHLIPRYSAASVVATLGAPSADLVAWLDSPDAELQALAVDVVFARSAREGGIGDPKLARAARAVIARGAVGLAPRRCAMLLERIDAFLRRS